MTDDRDERLIREIRGIRYLLSFAYLLAVLIWFTMTITKAIVGPPRDSTATELSSIHTELQLLRSELHQSRSKPPVVITGTGQPVNQKGGRDE
jgi:hypothetical protein